MTRKLGEEIKWALALLAVAWGASSAAQVPGDWWPDPTEQNCRLGDEARCN